MAKKAKVAKLTIKFEGTQKQMEHLAGFMSDGGGEDGFELAFEYDDPPAHINFDYSGVFPAHGYDPKRDGPDMVIVGNIVEDEID